MKGTIVNYVMSRHTQKDSHMVVKVSGYDNKEKSAGLVGKNVNWVAPGKNNTTISGKVAATHGNSGAVRVIFEHGMPGQAIGKTVDFN